MLPILFSVGPVKIYSYGVMLSLGLFVALYFWWKMGRDEHFDEISLFDGFFLCLITYLVAGRMGYVLLHMDMISTVYRFLAFLAYPGLNAVIGLMVTTVFMFFFARAQSWYEWKVADMYSVTLSLVLTFGSLGAILNGSNPVWQVSAWVAIWAFATFLIVSRVRKNFRFYSWYKGESSIAQEGLASLIFILNVGMYYMVVSLIDNLNWKIGIVPVELIIGFLIFVASIYLINKRVGRRDHSLWGKLSNIIRRK